jgi:hypothetical protein
MKRTDLAYVAGIIDGEGCITVRKARRHYKVRDYEYRLEIKVGLANEFLPKRLKFAFGGNICHENKRPYIWIWTIGGESCVNFLKAIYPYLILKKPQADVAFRFYNIRPKWKKRTPMDMFLEKIEINNLRALKVIDKSGEGKRVEDLRQ